MNMNSLKATFSAKVCTQTLSQWGLEARMPSPRVFSGEHIMVLSKMPLMSSLFLEFNENVVETVSDIKSWRDYPWRDY